MTIINKSNEPATFIFRSPKCLKKKKINTILRLQKIMWILVGTPV